MVVYPNATKDDGYKDMSKVDLSVSATIQQLRILVIFKFLQRLSEYFKQFKVDKDIMESARVTAQHSAAVTVNIVN